MKTRRVGLGFVLGLWLLWLVCPSVGQTADAIPPGVDIEVFTREGCPRCAAAKRFLDGLQQERPGLRIVLHDVGQDPAALARLQELAAKLGVQALGVPAFALRGELLIGFLIAHTTGSQGGWLPALLLPSCWRVARRGRTPRNVSDHGGTTGAQPSAPMRRKADCPPIAAGASDIAA